MTLSSDSKACNRSCFSTILLFYKMVSQLSEVIIITETAAFDRNVALVAHFEIKFDPFADQEAGIPPAATIKISHIG